MRTNFIFTYRDKLVANSYEFLNDYYSEAPKQARLLGLGVALIDVCAYPVARLADLVESAVSLLFNLFGKCCCQKNANATDFVVSIEDIIRDAGFLFIDVAFAPFKFIYQAIRIQTDLAEAYPYEINKDPLYNSGCSIDEEPAEGAAS